MPVSLLIALFLAFGTDAILPQSPVPRGSIVPRVVEASAAVGAVGLVGLAVSAAVLARVRRRGRVTLGSRRLLAAGSRIVGALTLGGYAWVILVVGWVDLVREGLKLRDGILVDELLILLPYVLAQVVGWWGLYPAEMALRPVASAERRPRAARYLLLRARQTLGMVLPAALIFSLAQDLARWAWPSSVEEPGFQMGMMAAMGATVLFLAPAFVRLSWPTRPLPPGPLRDRLERLASRFGFRFTDILVWDTGGTIVNAGVTGALPWYRFVLLTDALIEGLDPHEVAAVFGHEVGHVRHRHLAFFGFFFVGSMGVLTLASDFVSAHALRALAMPSAEQGGSSSVMTQGAITLALGLGYFGLIFGVLSRRFERQADVFGCRSVSCGRLDCPPHPDLYSRPGVEVVEGPLCPVGIRIFANALRNVAVLNGMEPAARSWRHGSINRRVEFLESLEGKPLAERKFQAGTARLRVALALALIAGIVLAFKTGAIEHLGP
jgi:STE24 endopeptidase